MNQVVFYCLRVFETQSGAVVTAQFDATRLVRVSDGAILHAANLTQAGKVLLDYLQATYPNWQLGDLEYLYECGDHLTVCGYFSIRELAPNPGEPYPSRIVINAPSGWLTPDDQDSIRFIERITEHGLCDGIEWHGDGLCIQLTPEAAANRAGTHTYLLIDYPHRTS